MAGVATQITLTEVERSELLSWTRQETKEHPMVQRARIVLEAAAGKTTKEISALLLTRPARVSKWRTRFARDRIEGLSDAPRSGKPPSYDLTTERRILAKLDDPPPEGSSMWNGPLVAEVLGDVSVHQVWRVLRKHGIQLQHGFRRAENIKCALEAEFYFNSRTLGFKLADPVEPVEIVNL